MSLSSYFYHSTTKRYIALFGSLFNKITIARNAANGSEVQRLVVPINYGPYQKWLIKTTQDADLNYKAAMILPRIAFEITSISYDGTRKVGSLKKHVMTDTGNTVYSGAPYNIDFTLYVMAKYAEDAVQIVEQIIPFFKPEKTYSVELIDGLEHIDIPIVMTSVSSDDSYEADFETRRAIMWTLTFTLKGWYYGPVQSPKRIKFMDIRSYIGKDDPNGIIDSHITIQPGLTEDGEPTDSISNSIPYQDIEFEDDWGTITVLEENIEEPEE
jgi:hypothetical protein